MRVALMRMGYMGRSWQGSYKKSHGRQEDYRQKRTVMTDSMKRFGHHLLGKGFVSGREILDALNIQRERTEFFGMVAVRLGKMTMDQVMEVLNVHNSRDMFGEIAVELGFLQPQDVDEIIEAQRNSRPPIGEILVEMGLIQKKTLAWELKDFHKSRA